jgi:hypothetical protein
LGFEKSGKIILEFKIGGCGNSSPPIKGGVPLPLKVWNVKIGTPT